DHVQPGGLPGPHHRLQRILGPGRRQRAIEVELEDRAPGHVVRECTGAGDDAGGQQHQQGGHDPDDREQRGETLSQLALGGALGGAHGRARGGAHRGMVRQIRGSTRATGREVSRAAAPAGPEPAVVPGRGRCYLRIVELRSVLGNSQRLDGGAMFGNCPRALWERWCPPDELGRIALSCRALLVREDGGRVVLLETGIGSFFAPKLRERYGVQEPEHVLLRSLAALGVQPDDVDVIVLSHLHFDHAGGLLQPWQEGRPAALAFPRARYVVGAQAWARANAPHARDRASFIPELQGLLEGTGRLEVVDGDRSTTLGEGYSFSLSHGHTPGLLLTR